MIEGLFSSMEVEGELTLGILMVQFGHVIVPTQDVLDANPEVSI